MTRPRTVSDKLIFLASSSTLPEAPVLAIRSEPARSTSGQGLVLTIPVSMQDIQSGNFDQIANDFDDLHEQLFTFRIDGEKEFVNLRAIVLGPPSQLELSETTSRSDATVDDAKVMDHEIFHNGAMHAERGRLLRR